MGKLRICHNVHYQKEDLCMLPEWMSKDYDKEKEIDVCDYIAIPPQKIKLARSNSKIECDTILIPRLDTSNLWHQSDQVLKTITKSPQKLRPTYVWVREDYETFPGSRPEFHWAHFNALPPKVQAKIISELRKYLLGFIALREAIIDTAEDIVEYYDVYHQLRADIEPKPIPITVPEQMLDMIKEIYVNDN